MFERRRSAYVSGVPRNLGPIGVQFFPVKTTMARTSKPSQSSGKPKTSSSSSLKKFNASGYEKRQSLKAAKRKAESSDVYEYAHGKTRRSKVTLDLDRDEAMDMIGGGGGGEQEEPRARLIGEHEEDEMIDSADDEEIDSDEAFEESDEERFAGFFSSKVGI